jgi:acetyl-CoA synthetase
MHNKQTLPSEGMRRYIQMADEPVEVTEETAESSGAHIAVHWKEEEYYQPPAKFVAQANASDPAILEQFTEDKFPECFEAYADLLTWDKKWDTVLEVVRRG